MTHPAQQQTRAVVLAVAACAGAVLAWLGASAAMLWATLDSAERAQAVQIVVPRGALLLLALGVLLAGLGWWVPRAWRRWLLAPAVLLEEARVLVDTDAQRQLASDGDAALQGLAGAINALVAQRAALRSDMALQVAAASRGIEQERKRLAALMSELSQAVVVCNLDGRILLYNASARTEFRALSSAPALADGGELIGLGRSIYKVFDRKLLAHALESLHQQLQRGVAKPSAPFLTASATGQWLRVQMAPVRSVGEPASGADGGPADAAIALNGFVLMLANVTREFEQAAARDQWLLGLTEGSRASLGNLQAAVEMLEYPDLDAAQRARFQAVVHDELRALGVRLQDAARQTSEGLATRWPLEDMLGADLVAAALRRLQALPGQRAAADAVDATLWLKVDSFSLLQALACLAGRLADEYDIKLVQLRLGPADASGQRAHLDLVWTGPGLSTETAMSWETDPMRLGGETTPLTLREVVQRHGGEFWFERERVRHQAFFRFLLPRSDAPAATAPAPEAALSPQAGRPEYYDFDLFQVSEQGHALDDQRLTELAFTVFDTETTGLNPSQGDEIIQIGAVRLLNGKLLRHETFEQLVDPQRSVPEAGIPIHGIRPEMLRGQPTIAQVLPAFHAFAQDTVLVAHNAAFDMRFLQLKQAATGLRFEQPVLDTLLLSAVVHPQQASHQLDAIARRLGVTVTGRHTALGDAMVTAEVFQKLVPLLAAMGLHTLAQVREAAQKTFYARVSY